MDLYKNISRLGLLIVLIGCLSPVYLNLNIDGLSSFLPGISEHLFSWFFVGTMFYSCLAGIIIAVLQMIGKKVKDLYYFISVMLSAVCGLFFFWGISHDVRFAVYWHSGIIFIFLGWVIALGGLLAIEVFNPEINTNDNSQETDTN